MATISSINVQPIKPSSEAHNQRAHKMEHIHAHLSVNNVFWGTDTIRSRRQLIETYCKEKSGRKLQCNATPIREAVVNLNAKHKEQDLHHLAERLQSEFKIECFQWYIHRDEGRRLDDGNIQVNHHAHMVFDWQDKATGKVRRLSKLDMVKMQTVVAEALNMPRGKEGSKAVRLEAQAYKAEQRRKEAEAATALAQKKTGLVRDFGLKPEELNWVITLETNTEKLNSDNEQLEKDLERQLQKNRDWQKRIDERDNNNEKLRKKLAALKRKLAKLKQRLQELWQGVNLAKVKVKNKGIEMG